MEKSPNQEILDSELLKSLSEGNTDVIKSLIEKGANINRVFSKIIYEADYELIIPALENGANANTFDQEGFNALDVITNEIFGQYYDSTDPESKRKNDVLLEIIKYLFDHNMRYTDLLDPSRFSLLITTINFGYYDIIKLLLEYGTNPNEVKRGVGMPLEIAIRVPVDQRNIETNMHMAHTQKKGQKRIAKLLLQFGANPNLYNLGESLLNYATRSEPSWIELLMDYGADINLPENKYLISNIFWSKDPCLAVKSFVNYGFNINSKNEYGASFLTHLKEYANENPQSRKIAGKIFSYINSILDENPEETDKETAITNLMIAAYQGQLDRLNLYLSSLNVPKDPKETVNFKKFFRFHKITNIDAADRLGNTALHYAGVSKNKRGIKFLLQRGANPLIKNNAGYYPKVSLDDLPPDYPDAKRKAFLDHYLRNLIGGYFSVIPKDLIGEIRESF